MSDWFSQWFPKRWSILHRELAQQVEQIKQRKRTDLKLDGRKTRWIKYWFAKQYKPKGYLHWLSKL